MIFYPDTDICIYLIRDKHPGVLKQWLRRVPVEIRIAAIVRAELKLGAEKSQQRSKNLALVERFLEPMEIEPFDGTAADEYGKLRSRLEKQGRPIGPNDTILAATVLSRKGTLVTNNTREFKRVSGLRVVNWTK